ncbi:uncharacterized protein LOC122177435 isoform X1 [Lagopus leucura]|uniref:uncharacterized protein LOC122177435 isoform X1 n=1 Tax=Lagopus leucura TaxID=30410 RepID=UPI001C66D677|nr:uncharacterized protein LOC122177435 isoform X1 [Lagopus leucura]
MLGTSHKITVLLAIYLGSLAHDKGCIIHLHVYQTLKSLFLRLLAKSSRNSLLLFADKCHKAKQNWKRRKTPSLLLRSPLQDSKTLQQANTSSPAQTAVKEQYAKRDIRLFLRKTSLRDCKDENLRHSTFRQKLFQKSALLKNSWRSTHSCLNQENHKHKQCITPGQQLTLQPRLLLLITTTRHSRSHGRNEITFQPESEFTAISD